MWSDCSSSLSNWSLLWDPLLLLHLKFSNYFFLKQVLSCSFLWICVCKSLFLLFKHFLIKIILLWRLFFRSSFLLFAGSLKLLILFNLLLLWLICIYFHFKVIYRFLHFRFGKFFNLLNNQQKVFFYSLTLDKSIFITVIKI